MKSALILVSLLTLVVGCDAVDAMKATKSMDDKMDQTNAGMKQTNIGIVTTNKVIAETNENIRLQKLILSKNDMLEKENTKNLTPVALGMIAGAKKFSEAATTEELMEYTFLLLKEINDGKPDDSLKNEKGQFPTDIVEEYDHQKMIKFNQILTIAGFTPTEKITQIIEEQIYEGGLYQDEAYAFLMARVFFLGTYLDNSLLAKPLKTVKKMEETINRIGSIDFLLKTPFKNYIKMNVTGFLKADAIEISLFTNGEMDDTWNAPKLWKKVMAGFKSDLKDGNVVTGSSVEQTNLSIQIAALKAKVQAYQDSWK
ncbi:MAG: hypothetical protein Q7U04_01735 [Bacteriovorax sp.]|nr:hypothetical protein [Bacteriovorax sp.]